MRLTDIDLEPITYSELLSLVKKREGDEELLRVAAALRDEWARVRELEAEMTRATAARRLAEARLLNVEKLFARGTGDVLRDVAEVIAHSRKSIAARGRMSEVCAIFRQRGGEQEAVANSIEAQVPAVEVPRVLAS